MKQISSLIIIICLTANIAAAQSNIFPKENYQIAIPKILEIDFYQPNSFEQFSRISIVSTKNIYAYDDLAIFCKIEVKMEKASGFPVKFRLGEVNYVEKLEGKPHSIFY